MVKWKRCRGREKERRKQWRKVLWLRLEMNNNFLLTCAG
jgi:hypothetical protein